MELGALWWLADKANVLVWVGGPLSVVAALSIVYSLVTISTLTSSGCLPPMIDELKLAQPHGEGSHAGAELWEGTVRPRLDYISRTNRMSVDVVKRGETEAEEPEWLVPEPIIPAQRRLLP